MVEWVVDEGGGVGGCTREMPSGETWRRRRGVALLRENRMRWFRRTKRKSRKNEINYLISK